MKPSKPIVAPRRVSMPGTLVKAPVPADLTERIAVVRAAWRAAVDATSAAWLAIRAAADAERPADAARPPFVLEDDAGRELSHRLHKAQQAEDQGKARLNALERQAERIRNGADNPPAPRRPAGNESEGRDRVSPLGRSG